MKILEARGIKKHFGGVVALSGASLEAQEGRITGLLGSNGSGKSTMSKIIAGVYRADAGEVEFKGRQVRYGNPAEAKRDGIAVVYQNLSLVGNLSVWQNIVLGIERTKGLFVDNKQAIEAAREIIEELMPGLDVRRAVSELSPAQMQIVEIAKAISESPKLLILDEPTAALELAQVQSLFVYLRRLAERGIAMIFTSHRLWEVMDICDDTVVFRNGENVAQVDLNAEGRDEAKLVAHITGESRALGRVGKRERRRPGAGLLKVRNLVYRRQVREVSFELRKGEILGIGGLAGQGQEELMRALAGFYPDLEGEVELEGTAIKLTRPKNAIRNNVLLVPGDREAEGLFLHHSVFSNIVFPRLNLRGQPLFVPRGRYRKECSRAVETLSIRTGGLDLPVSTLSGGNQQKVVIGRWLSFDIRVLLLSDPAKGVDVGAKGDLYEYIVKQVSGGEMSVILYASDNEELVDYCDRVLIMYEGGIVAELEGEELNVDRVISSSMNISGDHKSTKAYQGENGIDTASE